MKRLQHTHTKQHARAISRAELAESVGVSDVYVWYVLRGDRTPTLPIAARFAKALDLTLDDFYRLHLHAQKTGEPIPAAAAVAA